MNSLEGVTPGRLPETGEDESGGTLSGHPPSQAPSAIADLPPTEYNQSELRLSPTFSTLVPGNGGNGSTKHSEPLYEPIGNAFPYAAIPSFEATNSTSNRILGPLGPRATTETDATLWHDQAGGGSYGESRPSNLFQPPDYREEIRPPSSQPATSSTLGFPAHPPAPLQAVHSSVFTGHELVQPSPPSNEFPVGSCGCGSDTILESCSQLRQHLKETSKSENMTGTCTCFQKFQFLREYHIVVVAKSCRRILDHLRDMIRGNDPLDPTSRRNGDVDCIAPSRDNTEPIPEPVMTGGPMELTVNQPERVVRQKRSRSPSGDAVPASAKRTRKTRKGNTGAPSQTTQPVGSSPVDGTDLNPIVSPPEPPGPTRQKHARKPKGDEPAPFSKFPPQVQDMMNTLVIRIKESGFPQDNEEEPCLGDSQADDIMSFRQEADWEKYGGKRGESMLTLMVDMSEDGGFACMWCGHRDKNPKWKRTVAHIREHHLCFRPFPCNKVHNATCPETFASEEYQQDHIDRMENPECWPCTVKDCGGTYTSLSNLNRHLKTHRGHEQIPKPKRKTPRKKGQQ